MIEQKQITPIAGRHLTSHKIKVTVEASARYSLILIILLRSNRILSKLLIFHNALSPLSKIFEHYKITLETVPIPGSVPGLLRFDKPIPILIFGNRIKLLTSAPTVVHQATFS